MTRIFTSLLLMLLSFGSAARAEDYPTHTITIVVPFAAGSGSDTAARIISQQLTQRLGQTIIVENRAGATGAIAAAFVARAKPDGYTLLLGTNSTHGSNPTLYKKLNYDPVADFQAVAHTGDFYQMLLVHPDLPVKSVAELIAYGKANPSKLSYAGGNSTGIVMAETFAKGADIPMLRVAYRSTPTALTDVMANRVPVIFVDISSALSFVKAGNLRALAVTALTRSELVPELPTIDETAIKGYDIVSWTGLYAPAGTPRAIADKLNAEINAVLALPAVKERFATIGVELHPKSVDEFSAHTSAEVAKWTRLVKQAGIEPE